MIQVRLEAKTHTGKNKLALANAVVPVLKRGRWKIVQRRDSVLFSGKPGPWLLVAPLGLDEAKEQRFSRWVHETLDDDFSVYAL